MVLDVQRAFKQTGWIENGEGVVCVGSSVAWDAHGDIYSVFS